MKNKNTNVKITKVAIIATLVKPYNYSHYGNNTINPGITVNFKEFTNEGWKLVTGHGSCEIVPYNLFTYKRIWNEVTVNGNVTVTKKHSKNVTKEIIANFDHHAKAFADAEAAYKAKEERRLAKARIAALRGWVKFVKSGKAEAEIAELNAKL
jgi:hypothetical protein